VTDAIMTKVRGPAALACFLGFSLSVLSACGDGPRYALNLGDTDGVKRANELAIACNLSGALAVIDQTRVSGGLSSNIAQLQRVVFLRDAGRTRDANAALAEWNRATGATAAEAADTERSVQRSLADLRAERQSRTGSPAC
jgi:hypothetical protein